jgi:energy-coupling factor transport system substrate-specific component
MKEMTKLNDKKRYIIILLASVIMDIGFYTLCRVTNLPMWLDYVGTIFAAVTLEPAAGLLVGLVDNFYLAITGAGSDSIVYFAISAVIAICAGVMTREKGKLKFNRIILAVITSLILSSILSVAILLWRTSSFTPDDNWEETYFTAAVSSGIPEILASFLSSLITKVYGYAVAITLVVLFYFTFPKSLIKDRQKKEKLKNQSV